MGAPGLTFSVSRDKLSAQPGFDTITVAFTADQTCAAFECRATREREDYGVGKGVLVASFSATPAGIQRIFEIYDDFLVRGDGAYRISLYAQGEDGSWNDNHRYLPVGSEFYLTADGTPYLCMRG